MTADKCEALVVGGGPAGLAAAERLAAAGLCVLVVEAMPSIGRKFLMAGKSGLNLTKAEPHGQFLARYASEASPFVGAVDSFGPDEVIAWAEGLNQSVFTGSTGRVFPQAMKASPLLRAWLTRLEERGVEFRTRMRWTGWDSEDCVFDTTDGERRLRPHVAVMALGGGSWRRLGSDGLWVAPFRNEGIDVRPFRPSNVGQRVRWSAHMAPHFGAPVKATLLRAGSKHSRGEWVVTKDGIEGGGVYDVSGALRDDAPLFLDLVPDFDAREISRQLARQPRKISLSNRLRRALGLSPVARALFMELRHGADGDLAEALKALPVPVEGPMELDQAISTAGGVAASALDGFMLRARPGTFVAGEMLDWDAPTGGYLLTACLATGRAAGDQAAAWLSSGSGDQSISGPAGTMPSGLRSSDGEK